jgi:hypothetical protein
MPGSVHIDDIHDSASLGKFLSEPQDDLIDALVEFCYRMFSTSIYGVVNPSNEKYFKHAMNHKIRDSAPAFAAFVRSIMSAKIEQSTS